MVTVRKMKHLRNRLYAHIGFKQHIFCGFNFLLNYILLWRNAKLVLKTADDIGFAEKELVCNIIKADIRLNVCINKVTDFVRGRRKHIARAIACKLVKKSHDKLENSAVNLRFVLASDV